MKTIEKQRSINSRLIQITWPIFVEFVLLMLLGSMDILMLGNYSDNAVAAVGIVNQIINMLNLLFQIITAGTGIICAQYIGAKTKRENILKLSGTSLTVNLIIGFICSIVMYFASTFLLNCMNTAPGLMEYSKSYIEIVGGFIIIEAIGMTFSAILRSFGYTKVCMIITLIMNVYNVISNYALIYGNFNMPKLGVTGAAISTTVSRIIGAILLGIYLFKVVLKDFKLKYIYKISKEELKKILKIGAPSAGESIAYNIAKLMCTLILTYISVDALTVNSYINTIAMYIYAFSVSIGQGTAILVGQLVGEKRKEDAYKLCFSSLKKAMAISIVVAIIVVLLGRNILELFTDSESVINLALAVLLVNGFLEPGRTFNVVVINCLRAAGDVRFPVYIGVCSMWLIGVGLSYLLSITFGMGMVGMWIALALDEWLRGIIMCFRWKSKVWYNKALV